MAFTAAEDARDAARARALAAPPACRSARTRASAACCSTADGDGDRRGLPPRRRQPARRGRRAGRGRRPRPAAPPPWSPSSPATTPAAPARAPQALVDAGVRRVVFAQADTNPVAAGGAATLARGRHRGRAGPAARTRPARSTGVDVRRRAPAARSSPGSSPPPSTAAAPPPTAPAAGSPARRPAATPTGCAALCDAMLVGTNTVAVDDPELTVRDELDQPLPRQPLRVVMGERDLAPDRSGSSTTAPRPLHLRTRDPHDALAELFARDRQHVFLEGGPDPGRGVPPGRAGRRGRRLRRADAARRRPRLPSPTSASPPSPTRCHLAVTDVTVLPGHDERAPHRRGPDQRPHHDEEATECSPGSSRSSAPSRPSRTRATPSGSPSGPAPCSRTPAWATRSPSTAAASPSPSTTASAWTADVMQETLDKTSLRGVAARRPGQPRARGHRRQAARRPHRPGPRRRRRRDPCAATPSEHWEVVEISLPDGLGRYLVDKGSITVDGVSLTVVEAGDDELHRQPDPRDPGPHHARLRQPGDRVNLEVDVIAKHVEKLLARHIDRREGAAMTEPSTSRPARHRRAGHRRHRRRQGRRRRRRRGPRERGRHHLRRQQGDAGADGVHDPLLQRRDLRADAGRHARPARDPADDAAQQGQAAHGVHDLGRRPRRRHHRHLRRRPGAHRPGAGRLGDRAVGDHPARATSSRCATARAACWSAAATPRPPSTWPGSPG